MHRRSFEDDAASAGFDRGQLACAWKASTKLGASPAAYAAPRAGELV
jgi:hypothetical protein